MSHSSDVTVRTGVGPCPSPYTVDYTVAQSLSVSMTLLDSWGQVIGDASDALKGSDRRALMVPGEHRLVTVVFEVDTGLELCSQWEIVSFRLSVVGINSFIVTVGAQSSGILEVAHIP